MISAFAWDPVINAAGRLDDMRVGVRLLLTREVEEAQALAKTLDTLNAERRNVEADMLAKAEQRAETLLAWERHTDGGTQRRVLCLLDNDGHEGVVGLVAGRIKEATGLPTVVFAQAADPALLKGSARSVPNVHIRDILAEVQARYPDIIKAFGGHAMAAGLTIHKTHYAQFEQAIEAVSLERISLEALATVVWSDGHIEPEFFSLDLAMGLESFGPYGNEFAAPVFDDTFRVAKAERIGKDGQTLRLALSIGQHGPLVVAVRFRHGESPDPEPGSHWHMVYSLAVNRFRGEVSLQVLVHHLWPTENPA